MFGFLQPPAPKPVPFHFNCVTHGQAEETIAVDSVSAAIAFVHFSEAAIALYETRLLLTF